MSVMCTNCSEVDGLSQANNGAAGIRFVRAYLNCQPKRKRKIFKELYKISNGRIGRAQPESLQIVQCGH